MDNHEDVRTNSRGMSRGQRLGLVAAAVVIAFLAGFVPQWLRVQTLEGELAEARREIVTLELQTRLGAALSEAQRGNYERARQLMTGFFSGLQERSGEIGPSPEQRRELDALLAQRDEVITLLSRAQPESTSRLNMMFSRYFTSTNPLDETSTEVVTPPPPP